MPSHLKASLIWPDVLENGTASGVRCRATPGIEGGAGESTLR
ncbi:MAG: hypothetical protein ACFCVA_02510 [Gammaproteobacteria bacterium]